MFLGIFFRVDGVLWSRNFTPFADEKTTNNMASYCRRS